MVLVAELLHCCQTELQTVGDNCFSLPMTLQRLLKECKSGGFVPFPCDAALEDFAIMIDQVPQIDHLEACAS